MAQTITVSKLLHGCRLTLNDANSVRWLLPELLFYLNDGIREIALAKPNAVAENIEIDLAPGTYQTHDFLSLIRVTRNLVTREGSPEGRTGGRSITPIERPILDASMPEWQNPSIYPNTSQVDHIVQDTMDPQSFYVVPGNDGTGVIEALVAKLPQEITEPANPTDITAYTDIVPLHDVWRPVLVNYILYRAYTKDAMDPNNAQRAQAYYAQFASALGLKTQSETAANTDTTGAT